MRAGDIPSTPAILQRAAMVREETAQLADRHSAGIGVNRADDKARHSKAVEDMALQAIVATHETGRFRVFLIESEEYRTMRWVGRGQLDDVAIPDEPYRHVVGKVERARRARVNPGGLKTGPREHQYLRRHRRPKIPEHGRQIS